MFFRLLFLLLFALNLGIAGWLILQPEQPPLPPPPMTDRGVPALRLLGEAEAGALAARAELAAAPVPLERIAEERCFSLGPFPSQADLRQAQAALTPEVRRLQTREEVQRQPRGYWVYLPAFANRERALTVARELSAAGVRDYYVVTAGDQQNTISLGLFRDEGNAQRRQAAIAAQGFQPEVVARTEDQPVWWIDYALAPGRSLNWPGLLGGRGSLEESPVECF